jgi:ABC-type cobalamin/Fe3+-siderophores transport system ATPase subunit
MREARNLSRFVGGKALVCDVSVQIRPGEMLAVRGPSSAGKSSFLRLLNRLDEPSGGTVLLRSQDYRTIAPQALHRHVGMVMQTAWLSTSALDRPSAQVIEDLALGIVRERRMTCVLVTHSHEQAARLAASTMIMERGRMVAIGPTEEILHAF